MCSNHPLGRQYVPALVLVVVLLWYWSMAPPAVRPIWLLVARDAVVAGAVLYNFEYVRHCAGPGLEADRPGTLACPASADVGDNQLPPYGHHELFTRFPVWDYSWCVVVSPREAGSTWALCAPAVRRRMCPQGMMEPLPPVCRRARRSPVNHGSPLRANVLGLRARGISATHVPMGFARNLDAPLPAPDAVKDIDVLFFGV